MSEADQTWQKFLEEIGESQPMNCGTLRRQLPHRLVFGPAFPANYQRSLIWKILFNLLPDMEPASDSWVPAMRQHRKNYSRLLEKFKKFQLKAESVESQVIRNDPLSLENDSPWQLFFRDQELRKLIEQDVTRTFPDQDFFRQSHVQSMMTDLLTIYSHEHSELSYRQGMHELLGPILYVVCQDAVENVSEQSSVVEKALDSRYIEHDCYALFIALMNAARPFFLTAEHLKSNKEGNSLATKRSKFGTGSFSETLFSNTGSNVKQERPNAASMDIPLIAKCEKIQNVYLKSFNYKMWKHLEDLQIEPQLYGLRWFRLLFGREFNLENLLILWDCIFADDTMELGLVDWIALSLLLSMDDKVTGQDFATTLHCLMKSPPMNNPTYFVREAQCLRDAYRNLSTEFPNIEGTESRQGSSPKVDHQVKRSYNVIDDIRYELKKTMEPVGAVIGAVLNGAQSFKNSEGVIRLTRSEMMGIIKKTKGRLQRNMNSDSQELDKPLHENFKEKLLANDVILDDTSGNIEPKNGSSSANAFREVPSNPQSVYLSSKSKSEEQPKRPNHSHVTIDDLISSIDQFDLDINQSRRTATNRLFE